VFHLDVAFISMAIPCFKHMFQVFKTYVANVYYKCFDRMLQAFHLNVETVDRVLHMLQWCR
jgi:hypothetical protein